MAIEASPMREVKIDVRRCLSIPYICYYIELCYIISYYYNIYYFIFYYIIYSLDSERSKEVALAFAHRAAVADVARAKPTCAQVGPKWCVDGPRSARIQIPFSMALISLFTCTAGRPRATVVRQRKELRSSCAAWPCTSRAASQHLKQPFSIDF